MPFCPRFSVEGKVETKLTLSFFLFLLSLKSLYSPKRWQTLSTKFTSTFQTLYSLPPAPMLSTSLAAGLSALKLPPCSPSSSAPTPTPAQQHQRPQLLLTSSSNGSYYHPSATTSTPSSNPNPQANLSNLLLPHSLPLPLLFNPDASLNSPSHEHEHEHSESHNRSCPTCSPHLGFLAQEVPRSHQVNSVVMCRISGKVMDDAEGGTGGAMAFPNGYVYSYGVSLGATVPFFSFLPSLGGGEGERERGRRSTTQLTFGSVFARFEQALQEMAEQDEEGKVTCPRSGYRCEFGELRKVFLS